MRNADPYAKKKRILDLNQETKTQTLGAGIFGTQRKETCFLYERYKMRKADFMLKCETETDHLNLWSKKEM